MLFANKQESNLRSCIQMVEDAISSLGHSPEHSRLTTDDEGSLPSWRVQKGSAQVYILLGGRGDRNFIRVTAPVLHPDHSADPALLYRRLLELNEAAVPGAAFALQNGVVILTVERSTTDLDKSEVLEMVKHIEDYADHWDEILIKEFGGSPAGASSAPVA
jgi:hypothetical protein